MPFIGGQPAGLASPWRGRQHVAMLPARGMVPSGKGPVSTNRRHFPDVRAEQTVVNQPEPRIHCAFTPSVVAPWLLPSESEPSLEKAKLKLKELEGSLTRSMSSLEKKDIQRHLHMFGIPNLDMTPHKGLRGLRHSNSAEVFCLPPETMPATPATQVAAAAKPVKPVKPQVSQVFGREAPAVPDLYIPNPPPTRGLPIKATYARLTGPALRALADQEVVDFATRAPAPERERRVSFKPPSRVLRPPLSKASEEGDLTKTSAQSLTTTTGASLQASQASLASSSSLHDASPVAET
ncbi:unnamed protein product [Symbiodinium pilosum]|uniref:Uncharacterized protein n=1 Tax=Symbiodinium pilosum TaxID=2952 RepID=A0A812X7F4_SYMPI|nr:unnamed protein product [Symbiodinium pilosum]